MKKLFLLIFIVSIANIAFADKTAELYDNAIENGDYSAAYNAQSYIAPPYCYDLNKWQGVEIIKEINGRYVNPTFPFIYQDMSHLKVRQLRERAGIDEMIKKAKNDLELIQMISDWANKQWGHLQPLPYASWDAIEILDKVEKGDAFWCTYKAVLFVQGCNAAGLTARIVGINPKNSLAGTVAEVYNNDFRKWMLVDAWMNCYFERDGVPLSAVDYHNSMEKSDGIFLVFGENGYGTEYWDFKTGKADNIPHAGKRVPVEDVPKKGFINMYYDVRIVLRNDTTVHPQPKENIYVDGFMVPYNSRGGEWWGPQLKWIDDKTVSQITCANTNLIHEFEWPLNEVNVNLQKISVPGAPVVIEARFKTLTPNFNRYNLEIDGRDVKVDGDVYVWKLNKGRNTFKIATLNDAGREGFPSEYILEYDPEMNKNKRAEKVVVKIVDPGFEEVGENNRPLHWRTICSNALREGEFRLDKSTKHSGRHSLRATPARDSETDVEYAFIVRTKANIDVNTATDVIYTVWLKAKDNNTPVDICLLHAPGKGQGTYVKRVMVGKKWNKYELKCRLHNELPLAYVGFKVYTGTVWADDVEYVEVNSVR